MRPRRSPEGSPEGAGWWWCYRRAFEKRRCLIPADGFYEWRTIGGMKYPAFSGRHRHEPIGLLDCRAVSGK
ncbi:MAG: SOS response-associated peptidase family protein [Verrucomicrobia bacterium]|nr:SOS response-associated peptidase family protein [Verrucomicrobiota bacterium]